MALLDYTPNSDSVVVNLIEVCMLDMELGL